MRLSSDDTGEPIEEIRQQLIRNACAGVLLDGGEIPGFRSCSPVDLPVRRGALHCVVQYFVQ